MDIRNKFDIYRYMIENSQDIVFLLDTQDRFAFLNNRVESLLGFNQQELLGQHFSSLVYPADLGQVSLYFPAYGDSTDTEVSRSIELRFCNKNDCKDYRYFDIKIISVPQDVSNIYCDMVFGDNPGNRRIISYGVARDISQLKILSNIISTNMNYDYLTGLPNRVLLKDRMRQAIAHARRENSKFVVMFIDLDGFKQVNDMYGHSAGDMLLQAVSARLQACLREADTLARIGGDEFLLLLPNIHQAAEARKIADKLLTEIKRPFVFSGDRLPLTASIGLALYPDDGTGFDDLINRADQAMYHIKHGTKNGSVFFSELPETTRQANIFNIRL